MSRRCDRSTRINRRSATAATRNEDKDQEDIAAVRVFPASASSDSNINMTLLGVPEGVPNFSVGSASSAGQGGDMSLGKSSKENLMFPRSLSLALLSL